MRGGGGGGGRGDGGQEALQTDTVCGWSSGDCGGGAGGSEWIDAEPLAGTLSDASLCNDMDALVTDSSSLCCQHQHKDGKTYMKKSFLP